MFEDRYIRFRDAYRKGFMSLTEKYVELYKQGVFKLEMLRTLPAVKDSILVSYNMMVDSRELCPIENLDAAAKANLWQLCKPLTTGLDADGCRNIARCYLTLDYVAGKKEGAQ